MSGTNLPFDYMGEYVARVQRSVLEISQIQQRVFLPDGSVLLRGDLSLGGNDIFNANSISVGTLHYTALDPPISSGGNISGPITSTNHALVRYDGTSGDVVLNSPFTLSDDGKLTAPGGTIDLSTPGVINLSASLVTVAGYNAVASVSPSAVDSDIAVFAGTNGYSIKTSGIPVSSIANKLPFSGGTMSGSINMGGNSLTNVLNIVGSIKTSAVDSLVTSSASLVSDSDIAVFDSTTGKIIKGSGIQVSSIAAKLPLAGGTMTGAINMNNLNITNVAQIVGSVKTNNVNDLVTSITGAVVANNIPVWSGTTGRIISDSGIAVSSLTIGAASATDNAIARFDLTSGKLIQNSSVTLSDDAKIAASGGTIDLSVPGVINLVTGGAAQVNGSTIMTAASSANFVSGPASAINNRVAAFDLTTGKLIKDSGILYTDITIGPTSATDNAIARFDLTTGKLIQNSALTIGDDAKLSGSGGTIDFGVAGVLALSGTSVTINGSAAATASTLTTYVQGPLSAVGDNIATYNGATGKLIKDSGVAIANIVQCSTGSVTNHALARFNGATGRLVHDSLIVVTDDIKIQANSSTIDFATPNSINLIASSILINGSAAATAASLSAYVQGPVSSVNDNIATYNGVTGKLIKDSGVAVSSIATKLPLAGGVMTGSINMGANNLLNVGAISGSVKTSAADDLVTGTSSPVIDSDIPIWSGTTGRILKTSGILVTAVVIGPASATDNAIARFDLTTGKLIQNSTVTLSDDAKIAGPGGTIDLSTAGVLDLVASSVRANGSAVVTSAAISGFVTGPASAVDSNIAVYDLTTGKLIKDSGVAVATIATKLPLAGGTMSGSINMGGNSLTNVLNIAGSIKTSAVNDIVTSSAGTTVDSDIAVFDSTTGRIIKTSGVAVSSIATKLPLAGGTMSGSINMSSNSLTNVSLISFPSGNVSLGVAATGGNAVAIGNSSTAASAANTVAIGTFSTATAQYATAIGNLCNSTGLRGITIGGGNLGANNPQADGIAIGGNITLGIGASGIAIGAGAAIGAVSNAIAIGTSASNNTASSFLFGDSAVVNIRPNNTGTCDLGTTTARFKDLLLSGSISGPSNSRTVDNIVSNAGGSAFGNVVIFSGSTGKVIQDSGILASDLITTAEVASSYLPLSGGTMSGNIAMGGNSLTNVLNIIGSTKSSAVNSLVTSTAISAVDSDIAIFDSITGKIIKGSGIQVSTIATKLPLAGGTMSGAINMGANNITNIGSISGSVKTSAVDAIVTSSATLVVDSDIAIFDLTTGKIIKGSGVQVSTIASKLPLAGGTMTGAINMGTNNITNIGSISGSVKTSAVDAIVTSSAVSAVDSDIAIFDSTTGKIIKGSGIQVSSIAAKLPLAGGTMTGSINMGGNSLTNVLNIAGSVKTSAVDSLVTSSAVSAVDSDIAIFDSTTGKIIKGSGIQVSSIAAKLPLAGGTMTGVINMGTNNITNIGSISGSVKTSAVDAIVTSSAVSAVDSDIAIFDSTTGKIIKGSGIQVSTIAAKLPLAGGTMSGSINMGGNSLTNVLNIAGSVKTSAVDSLVTSSASVVVDSDIAIFDLTTGKIIKGSGIQVSTIAAKLPLAGGTMTGSINMGTNNITNIGTISGATNSRSADNIVSNAGASVSNNVAIFSGTTGKVITDSGASLSQYAQLAGATFTGSISMGANNITGTGSISAGSLNATNATASTSPTTGAIISAGGLGVSGKIYAGSNVVVGAVQTVAIEHALTLRGTDSSAVLGPHMAAYAALDQYPLIQMYNFSHDNISLTWDAYNDSVSWKSSYATSNYQLVKNSNQLTFNVSPGAAVGTAVTWTAAGFINTSGVLQWNKQVKITDATVSSSTSTGCLVLSGGLGVAGAMTIAGTLTATGSLAGATNTRTVDNIVSNAGTGIVGNVVTIANVSGKVVQDSGTALSALATSASVAATYLPLAGGVMSGSINMGTNNLTNIGLISGSVKTSIVDNIVTSSASGTVDADIAVFDSTTGKIIRNSSVQVSAIATKLPLAGGTMSGSINMGNNSLTNVATIAGPTNSRTADNIVSNAGAGVSGNVVTFSGATGKVVQDGGVALSALATSASVAATYLPLAGGTMTGTIAMGTNNITGTGAISSGTLGATSTTASTSPTTGAIISAGGLGVAGKTYVGSNTVIGPSQAIASEQLLTLRGTDSSVLGPHIIGYADLDAYPLYQMVGYSHDDVSLNFDYYWDGTNWRSGSASSNFNIRKTTSQLEFNYNSGVLQGVISAFNLAGYINTTGSLVWQKPVNITNTTPSSNPTTGALVVSGGIGASGSLWLTGSATIPGSLSGGTYTRQVNDIVSIISPGSTNGNVPTFSGTSGRLIQDGGVALSALATSASVAATYLPLAGGTMTGSIAMGTNNLTNVGTISGATNSRSADNIVSCAGTSTDGRVATFSGATGKIIQDGGTLLSALATSASLANYLLLAGGTMTGNINMGAQSITNAATITTTGTQINFGYSNTLSGGTTTVVGAQNTIGGSAGGSSIVYGYNNNLSGTTNGQSIVFGSSNIDSNASGGVFIFGFGNTNGTGARNIMIGRNNTIPTGVDNGIAIGFNQTNSTSNSLLVGVSDNIRASSTSCDLGTSTATFKTLYLNTSIVGASSIDLSAAGTIAIGGTNATAVNLGRAGQGVSSLGNFNMTVSIGRWYSTTAYNPTFSANVNRLTPPTSATAGSLTEFTHSTGVLTYTGTRTRDFVVLWNITWLAGANGAHMTFFNAVNGNLIIGTQTRAREQVNTSTAALFRHTYFSDVIQLVSGDTIQLAGACAAASTAVSYQYVSCMIYALPN